MGIIEETAIALGIGGFKNAADQVKYEVYKLTLRHMFMTLGQPPVLEYLERVLEGLQAMENGFYILINRAFQGYNLTIVLPILIDAKSFLESALSVYGVVGREPDFFGYKGRCRMKINEIIQHLVQEHLQTCS